MSKKISCYFNNVTAELDRGRLSVTGYQPGAAGEEYYQLDLVNAYPFPEESRSRVLSTNLIAAGGLLATLLAGFGAAIALWTFHRELSNDALTTCLAVIIAGTIVGGFYFGSHFQQRQRHWKLRFFRGPIPLFTFETAFARTAEQEAFLQQLQDELKEYSSYESSFRRHASEVLPECFAALDALRRNGVITDTEFLVEKQRRFRAAGILSSTDKSENPR